MLDALFRRLLPWIFVLTLCLFSAGQTPQSEPALTTVPMQVVNGHASVEVQVNGASFRFLLDTGADHNVISEAAAQQLRLRPSQQQVPSSGASGSGGLVSWVQLKELRVGEMRQRKPIAFVVPLPKEFSYDGILGTPFFEAFITTLDYEQRELRLFSRQQFVPPSDQQSIPLRREGNKLLVTATAASITGWFVLDIGAGNALTLYTPTVEKHQLRTAFQPSIRTITGVSVGGYTQGDLVRLPTVSIGPYQFQQVVAELSLAQEGLFATPHYVGNLGAELWRRFTLTFDYSTNKLYLKPNSAYQQPFVGPRSGLIPLHEQNIIRVLSILPSSPASEAGLLAGDLIEVVDGVPAASLSPSTLRDLLNQDPGTKLRLSVRRPSAGAREVVLTLRDLL